MNEAIVGMHAHNVVELHNCSLSTRELIRSRYLLGELWQMKLDFEPCASIIWNLEKAYDRLPRKVLCVDIEEEKNLNWIY